MISAGTEHAQTECHYRGGRKNSPSSEATTLLWSAFVTWNTAMLDFKEGITIAPRFSTLITTCSLFLEPPTGERGRGEGEKKRGKREVRWADEKSGKTLALDMGLIYLPASDNKEHTPSPHPISILWRARIYFETLFIQVLSIIHRFQIN